jgi:hypothetical protein
MRASAGVVGSDVVDVYNGQTGAWSTAQLRLGRSCLTASSVRNMVMFAGGSLGGVDGVTSGA